MNYLARLFPAGIGISHLFTIKSGRLCCVLKSKKSKKTIISYLSIDLHQDLVRRRALDVLPHFLYQLGYL
jgi:hypothetical protein